MSWLGSSRHRKSPRPQQCSNQRWSKSMKFVEIKVHLSPQHQTDLWVHDGPTPIIKEEVVFKPMVPISKGVRGATNLSIPMNHHVVLTPTPTQRSTNLLAMIAGISTTSMMFAIASRGSATRAMKKRLLIDSSTALNGETPTLLFSRLS